MRAKLDIFNVFGPGIETLLGFPLPTVTAIEKNTVDTLRDIHGWYAQVKGHFSRDIDGTRNLMLGILSPTATGQPMAPETRYPWVTAQLESGQPMAPASSNITGKTLSPGYLALPMAARSAPTASGLPLAPEVPSNICLHPPPPPVRRWRRWGTVIV